ncbi:MAG: response regulator, partial [Deltaproteobacteria bacterium]|nr:response regulator [Deltaproteobacteria bacterium]
NTIPFPMDIVDDTGTILYMSELKQKMAGKNGAGKKCWLLYRDDKVRCPACPLETGITVGETKTIDVGSCFGGKQMEVTHTGMIYKSKKVILEIFYDITERKKADEALKNIREKLEEKNFELKRLNEVKSEFVATVSHELRTPLASIKEAISLILDGVSGETNEKQRNFLSIANRNIDRLTGLINNLLDISKIETGKLKLYKTNFLMADVIKEVIDSFKHLAENKRINLRLIEKTDLPSVYADKDKITQIIINLLSNALKFTPEGGFVEVSTDYTKSDKEFVEVEVKDSGMGIAEDDMPKLFHKFQQIDGSITRKIGGTGLGLAISREIIEMHEGRIWAASELGKGSRFGFILPVIPMGKIKVDKKRILIIDDDPDLCETLKTRLEANEFIVFTALNGMDGIELAKKNRPNLIILDLMMPEMDGFQVCQSLMKDSQTSSIPVVVLTVLDQEEAIRKALCKGAVGYMIKPYDSESLLETVREFL